MTVAHVIENVLHRLAVRKLTRLDRRPVGLLAALALVGVQQQNELLLDEAPLLGVCSASHRRLRHARLHGWSGSLKHQEERYHLLGATR